MGEPIVASCTLGNNQPVVISASGVHGNRENSTEDVSEIVKDTKPEVIESKLVLTVDATENVSNIKVSGDSTFVKITKSEFTHEQVVTKTRQDSLGEVKANGDTIPSEKADNEEKSTQNETGHEKESNINANETPESSDSKLQQHEKDETKGEPEKAKPTDTDTKKASTNPYADTSDDSKDNTGGQSNGKDSPEQNVKKEDDPKEKPKVKQNIFSLIFGCFGCKRNKKKEEEKQ